MKTMLPDFKLLTGARFISVPYNLRHDHPHCVAIVDFKSDSWATQAMDALTGAKLKRFGSFCSEGVFGAHELTVHYREAQGFQRLFDQCARSQVVRENSDQRLWPLVRLERDEWMDINLAICRLDAAGSQTKPEPVDVDKDDSYSYDEYLDSVTEESAGQKKVDAPMEIAKATDSDKTTVTATF